MANFTGIALAALVCILLGHIAGDIGEGSDYWSEYEYNKGKIFFFMF